MHLHMMYSDVGKDSHAVLSGWTRMTCFWRSRNHGLWSMWGLYVLLDAWPGILAGIRRSGDAFLLISS